MLAIETKRIVKDAAVIFVVLAAIVAGIIATDQDIYLAPALEIFLLLYASFSGWSLFERERQENAVEYMLSLPHLPQPPAAAEIPAAPAGRFTPPAGLPVPAPLPAAPLLPDPVRLFRFVRRLFSCFPRLLPSVSRTSSALFSPPACSPSARSC